MNYQFPRPRMLQMKFDPNWTSGFNLSLKELMFESVDRQQTMTETVYPISSPRAFSSGELKRIKTVQAYKVNKPIKSQPNMISEEIIIQIFFPIFILAFWFPWQPITRASQAGQYMPIHYLIIWKKVLTGILNSPVQWRDNRVKVDKILSI